MKALITVLLITFATVLQGQSDTIQTDTIQLKPGSVNLAKQILEEQKRLTEAYTELQKQLQIIVISTLDDPEKYIRFTDDRTAIVIKKEGK